MEHIFSSTIARYLMVISTLIGIFPSIFSEPNEIFLNHTEVNIGTNIDLSNGFSFSFRACSEGVVLRQNVNDLSIVIENSTVSKSYHKNLIVNWKTVNPSKLISNKLLLNYSLDSNILITFKLIVNSNGTVVKLTPDSSQTENKLQLVEKFIPIKFNLTRAGNLTVGSKMFYGCIRAGDNIDINYSTHCPLANFSPCEGGYVKVCPAGFTGRYCETNIDDCVKGPCQQSSRCMDLIEDYKCQCGKQYTGKNCENYLGSPCLDEPCNNGTCNVINNGNDFTCNCKSGFTGKYCESPFQPCNNSPCLYNGTCENRNSVFHGYKCKCVTGFSGTNCEKNINDCANGKCFPGTCKDGVNKYTCNCSGSGFRGDDCKENINECVEIPNLCNNGTCKDLVATLKYMCNCDPGYTGKHCDGDLDECTQNNPCKNGKCFNQEPGYRCQCDPGYKGVDCDQDVDECKFNYCKNSNNCLDKKNDYECSCKSGYTGKNCTVDVNECLTASPCLHGGSCENTNGSYACNCVPGYEGVNCSVDIDECQSRPCHHNGTCQNLQADYNCTCTAGYTGKSCETNIDDCKSNPCQNYGKCSDGVNGYACSCIPSWTGTNCTVYQDPCSSLHPCLNNGTCFNDTMKGYGCNCTQEYGGRNCEHRIGKCYPDKPCIHGECIDKENYTNYTCNCTKGYIGYNCEADFNECEENPCMNKRPCNNTDGSFRCECGDLYRGKYCDEDVDECKDNPCQNNGVCKNFLGGYQCDCPRNYVEKNCELYYSICVNYKGKNGKSYCENNGKCIDISTSEKECDCQGTGFEGIQCESNINDCDDNTCVHGKCYDLINDFNCTCDLGYTGKNCSENVNDCLPDDPCENGGKCMDLVNSYQCNCSYGFNGTNCSNNIDWCVGTTCHNGGSCNDGIETYNCSCKPGFTGQNCETDIDECEANPCRYNSSLDTIENLCLEKSNLTAMLKYNFSVDENSFEDRDGYRCICEEGLSGANCAVNAPDCSDSFCGNNGTCVDRVNNYTCNCVPGWTGRHCDVDINECAGANPCKNNGSCIDLINKYECSCTTNYTGVDCETQINYCSINEPCQNDAECTSVGDNDFSCTCKPGFTGKDCGQMTTVNFSGEGYWEVAIAMNSTVTFEISLWFRTTLKSGVLLFLNADTPVYVYLKNHTVVINFGDEYPFIDDGISYNDGAWHQLYIAYKDDKLFRAMDNSSSPELGSSLTIKDVRKLFIGGMNKKVATSNFTGCVRDLVIGRETLSPSVNGTHSGIKVGSCVRPQKCMDHTCSGHGVCVDLWVSVSCNCDRQFFGTQCESEMQSLNFQPVKPINATRQRRSTTQPTSYASSNVMYELDDVIGFSFLLRTRQSNSFIAVLLSKIPKSNTDNVDYLLVQVQNGRIAVKSVKDGKLTAFEVNERVDVGQWIEVRITKKFVMVIDTKEYKDLHPLSIRHIFMGGIDDAALYSNIVNQPGFEGCLQAVKLENSYLTNEVISNATTNNLTAQGVRTDICKGDNVCQSSPCLFNGTCVDVWNDFKCECGQNYQGKTCADYGCSVSHTCSSDSACVDVPNQPGATRCSSPLTYNGFNSSTTVRAHNASNNSLSFVLRTRQENALIFTTGARIPCFKVIIENGNLTFTANYGGSVNSGNNVTFSGEKINIGTKQTIYLTEEDGMATLYIDNNKKRTESSSIFKSFVDTVNGSDIFVGNHASDERSFQGCFSALNIGGTDIDLASATSVDVVSGCVSSLDSCPSDSLCENGGTCRDNFNDFKCDCQPFYTKKTCNETIDVNCAFMRNLCGNGKCKNDTTSSTRAFSDNGVDLFKCDCNEGFMGTFCENVTNECDASPCANNGTCTDLHLGFNCTCPLGYYGEKCEHLNIELCVKTMPCQNGASCFANVTGYFCTCATDFSGADCQISLKSEDGNNNLLYIIVFSILGVLILIIIIAVVVVKYCRDKSGMEGTYSPNKEEQTAGNVEMSTVKKPKTERLI